ncbi:MAG TPA: DUF4998 domain-containing protein [Chitinophagaceae bacterium]|nr:DUF4998 domain-containing protein [Chitinophagaceae bacterium]
MKNIFQITLALTLAVILFCCKKSDTEFRDFLEEQEIIYPGVPVSVNYRPGNERIMLLWKPSPDPGITKYVVYWNNKADSTVITSANADTVKVLIPNLNEYVYSFTIYSYDAKGNSSIPLTVNNAKVYGPLYTGGLLNRGYNAGTPYVVNADGSVQLNFNTPDTINITTSIKYTNQAGNMVETQLAPGDNSITLPDYKAGTIVQYRSSYIPVLNAIDTFNVASYSDFPQIYTFVQANKSLFRENALPNDVGTYSGETSVSRLWDGSVGPQGYPNIFHSDGSYLPHVLTFDMGQLYNNLGQMEETGRDCCNNPTKFEVWGIADITNAATTLRADDAGWKAEAIAKGWTLLKEVTRTDDGKPALKYDLLENPPPVRYIRIRVINTATGSTYSNFSEVTFWNKQ